MQIWSGVKPVLSLQQRARGQRYRFSSLRWVGVPVLLLLATCLWAVSLPWIDVKKINDLGLISVLPWSVFAALLLLTASFCMSLRQETLAPPWLAGHIVVIIFILYGTPALIEEVPRFESVWKHVGVAEYILRTGTVAPQISAYYSWPGFFILTAFGTQIVGAHDPLGFVLWFPVLITLVQAGAIFLILKAITPDQRVWWFALWFFLIANWIGQDYFSPQAVGFFLYLTILAVLLNWFKGPQQSTADHYFFDKLLRWRRLSWLRTLLMTPERVPNRPSTPGQRVLLYLLVIAATITIIASHQLTPFLLIIASMSLVVTRILRLRWLPLLFLAITIAWLSFMAGAYLYGNAAGLFKAVGQVSNSVDANVTNRLRGSNAHMVVIYARLVMSGLVWGLAIAGGLRMLLARQWSWAAVALGTLPFLLVIIQPYGGEMLLRVYLFVLPFMAYFVALLFLSNQMKPPSLVTTTAMGITSIVIVLGCLLTRYGNERADAFTRREVAGLNEFYQQAQPNSLIITMSENMPFRFRDFEKFTMRGGLTALIENDEGQLITKMASGEYQQRYLIVTRSQQNAVALYNGITPAEWTTFMATLQASPRFQLVVSNEDVQVYQLVQQTAP